MACYSPFTISGRDAQQVVRTHRLQKADNDNRQCYMLQVAFQSVYGASPLPQSIYKKLPRIINGIPLGAGRLSQNQANSIMWRYVEGCIGLQTFISSPITWEDADEAKRALKDQLVRQAKAVFGDITVKASIILSQCVHFDSDFFINDIADTLQEGLHFHD